MSLASRFQTVVDQLAQGNKKQFAEMTGKSASHIYKICRGMSRPSMAYLQELYNEYRVDLTWLLTGEQSDAANPAGVIANSEQVHAPMFDVQASAGAGMMVEAEDIADYFTFNKSFLSRQLGVSGEQLAFVTISGDSMMPTLRDGDQVLVDMSQKNIQSGSIYLLNTDTGLVAKRIRPLDNSSLDIISDNQDYDSWILNLAETEDNPLMGKVVWSARSV